MDDDFTFDDKSSIANSSCVVSVFVFIFCLRNFLCYSIATQVMFFFNERYLHVVNKLFKLAILSVAILGHVTVH